MAAIEGSVEICALEGVVELRFVVFCYVEDKWAYSGVSIGVVLSPCCCSSDGYDYACCGFADFYG